VPKLNADLISLVLPELPAIIIILVIEHIAIAKSFGRSFSYTIIPSQEIIAQGVANLFGPFVGGYTCTGSFGASAVLSKAGVRTPLAGLFSAMILVLALYALTTVFYYIPMAALAGLIIHAVSNLITSPEALYRYWLLSPFELLTWIAGVIIALFTSLETSIYVTISLSLALLLVRLARARGRFLGRVRVYRLEEDTAREEMQTDSGLGTSRPPAPGSLTTHDAFLSIDRDDASNPSVVVGSPYPGVFVYRFREGLNYINQGHHGDYLRSYITTHTRRTKDNNGILPSDRLWSDAGTHRAAKDGASHNHNDVELPILRAVVLDFAAVNNIDITSVQGLLDLRNILDAHSSPAVVEWHFANVQNRWTRRALAVAGFGFPAADPSGSLSNWVPVYAVASSLAGATMEDVRAGQQRRRTAREGDCEGNRGESVAGGAVLVDVKGKENHRAEERGGAREVSGVTPEEEMKEVDVLRPLHGVDRPFFHIDLIEAVDAAVRDAVRMGERQIAVRATRPQTEGGIQHRK
jgi:solute carrier family 26 (sodium-independent sulfate anion transporter), member 11